MKKETGYNTTMLNGLTWLLGSIKGCNIVACHISESHHWNIKVCVRWLFFFSFLEDAVLICRSSGNFVINHINV